MDKKQLIDIVSVCIIGAMSETGAHSNGQFVTEHSIQEGLTVELNDLICLGCEKTEEMQDMIDSLVNHIMAIRIGRKLSE